MLPANGRVAAAHLKGRVSSPRYTEGERRQVAAPVADLRRAPNGPRERQLLAGAPVRMFEDHVGWAFVQAECGYVGYMRSDALGPAEAATHVVRALASHVYAEADLKSPDLMTLSLGTRLCAAGGVENGFLRTGPGFVPMVHLRPIGAPERDPVAVAERFLGTPYLWGGNSRLGLDCSGLVQAAMRACGIPCPGDADLQEAALGRPLREGESLQRGDLLFWPGHVAFTAGDGRILHANARDMAVAYEDMAATIARIDAAGDGPLRSRRRVDVTAD